METPDTEKYDVIGWLRNTYGLDDDDCLSAGRVQELCESLVDDFQTSRDKSLLEAFKKDVGEMIEKMINLGHYYANGEREVHAGCHSCTENEVLSSLLALLKDYNLKI